MKRILGLLVSILTIASLTGVASAASERYWKVQISKPVSETSTHSLRINYNVYSTVASDTFSVELFENGTSKGTQSVTHPYGNSGVFSIALPSNGTYNYHLTAQNIGASESKDSETVSVEVVNGPEPTVTTVFVQNPNDTGQNTGTANNTAAAETAGTETGQVAGAEQEVATSEGGAASTEQPTSNSDEGSVLGAEDKAADSGSSNLVRNTAIGVIIIAILLYAAYKYKLFTLPFNK